MPQKFSENPRGSTGWPWVITTRSRGSEEWTHTVPCINRNEQELGGALSPRDTWLPGYPGLLAEPKGEKPQLREKSTLMGTSQRWRRRDSPIMSVLDEEGEPCQSY